MFRTEFRTLFGDVMSRYCPQCNNNVPEYAKICKYCDYDFPEKGPSKGIPIALSIAVLLLGRSETATFTGAEAQRDQIAPINNNENAILERVGYSTLGRGGWIRPHWGVFSITCCCSSCHDF